MSEIRPMQREDVAAVAAIHRRAYPADHFSQRLPAPLAEALYEHFRTHRPYCYVATDDGKVVGAIVAGMGGSPAIRSVAQAHPVAMAVCIVRNVDVVAKSVRSALMSIRKRDDTPSAATAWVASVFVDPDAHKRGIAAQLMRRVEEDLRAAGVEVYGLGVKKTNDTARRFYESIGMHVEGETPSALRYVKPLATQAN